MAYTIRNVGEKTKETLAKYASDHGITVGEALTQLVDFGIEYYEQNKSSPKKYLTLQDAMRALPEW
ncbi:MAG TPA: hypothetical protein VLD37_03875 [Candidatus Bilamarchaeum sp.]|nr:hypothetical protein [Candidatus Bilamarchaeum sp.]